MTPNAADDLPLPWPVFTRTIDSARATRADGSQNRGDVGSRLRRGEPGANPGLSRNCDRGATSEDGHGPDGLEGRGERRSESQETRPHALRGTDDART